jgi:prepilin-type N-terminal cleavage/methylation domain-containing protein
MTMFAHRPRRRGFTLIEILVVVLILGIAAATVMPSLGTRNDLRATAAARVLMSDLIYAQNLSISRQRMHYVRFDPAAESYEVLSAIAPTAARVTHPVENNPFAVSFAAAGNTPVRDVEVSEVSFDGKPTIAFDELGTPYAYDATTNTTSAMSDGSIVLKCKTNQVTITVEAFSGALRVN